MEQVHKLLALNQTNKAYYYQVLEAKEIDYNDPTNVEKVVETLTPYMEQYPKSNTPLRIILKCAPADSPIFEEKLKQYLRPLLIKGVPSVINDLKLFYRDDPKKAAILGSILDDMSECMEACMCLSKDDEEEQDPTVQLWLYLFQSQHYMRYAIHGGPELYTKSIEFINKAIEHTPTVVELYIHKAKLYQRMGNPKEAAKLTEEARNLDLADRYLNAHSSKYLFKNNKVQQANETMALFSRDQDSEKLNVHEMATLWYEFHCGMSHFRTNELRQSLKQLSYLEKHFQFMFDDCCDFFYCSMRRGTVMHFLQMWKWQNNIYQGKWPIKSCIHLLKLMARIQKNVVADQSKQDEAKAEQESYFNSEEHKKWLKEWEEKDEDHNELRNDPDPKGWSLYMDVVKDPSGYYLNFAE